MAISYSGLVDEPQARAQKRFTLVAENSADKNWHYPTSEQPLAMGGTSVASHRDRCASASRFGHSKERLFGFRRHWQGGHIAGWGTFFDVAVVGVILVLFAVGQTRRQNIRRYMEEIEDFKKWDNEEARLRLAGNIRRLARLGKTDIDFSGIVLRDFSFGHHDIVSLRGATFSLGLRLDRMSKNDTELENVDFSFVDCRDVVFSKSFGGHAVLGLAGKNLNFIEAGLNGACFEGAKLSWTNYKANASDWYEEDEDQDGHPIRHQVHYPAFSGADLAGCSFRYAQLDHADFRDAHNVLEADFFRAKGLETCFFDEAVRERILASASMKSRR